MNLLLAAMSGWGKSYLAQSKAEKNIPGTDYFVALDYDDEYRGLVEHFPDVRWFPVGPKEKNKSAKWWLTFFQSTPKVVLPRYMLTDTEWREISGRIAQGLRYLHEVESPPPKILVVIDEAHAVAPQQTKYPESIGKLAVAGRGENVSTIWVTQRLAMLDKDIVSQCHAQYIGGWIDPNDLKAISVEYPNDAHNPKMSVVPGLPPELKVKGQGLIPVRQFTEGDNLIGSEWIFSDERGSLRREDSRTLKMQSKHYAPQGYRLAL